MTETQLVYLSIGEIARLYRRGKLSPVELTKILLERIERLNPRLNAFITVTGEAALAEAKRAERALMAARKSKAGWRLGVLHGIPISLKDNVYTTGVRTTGGSRILRDFVPARDAILVEKLKRAGAIVLGKTNMHEFAYGVTSNNPHYGAVRNPWNRERIAGGSSGGSAAAVAAGLGCGSIGSDTGGSIRIPAGLCGVTGLKPTLHRVSVDGVIPLSPTLDCVGPIARSTEDARILFEAIAEPANARRRPKVVSKSWRRLSFGMPRQFFFDVISDEVRRIFDATMSQLRKLGAKVKEISIPMLPETETAGNLIAWPEASLYHYQSGWLPDRATDYSEDVRSRVEAGTKVTAIEYLEALEQRKKFIQQLSENMASERVDALVTPTTPMAAPIVGEEKTRIGKVEHSTRALLLRLNRPANLAGVPAISVPCGFTKGKLPVGLQFMGLAGSDELLLDIAARYEASNPITERPDL